MFIQGGNLLSGTDVKKNADKNMEVVFDLSLQNWYVETNVNLFLHSFKDEKNIFLSMFVITVQMSP